MTDTQPDAVMASELRTDRRLDPTDWVMVALIAFGALVLVLSLFGVIDDTATLSITSCPTTEVSDG